MRGFIGVTDGDWSAQLRATGQTEANFWIPSGKNVFRALKPGEPFLFKTHYPDNRIVGGGFFEHATNLHASEARDFMGVGNGVPSLDELVARVHHYRGDDSDDDPVIGCIILGDLTFFAEDTHLSPPSSFAKNIVQGKGYALRDNAVDSEAEQLFGLLFRTASVPDLGSVLDQPAHMGHEQAPGGPDSADATLGSSRAASASAGSTLPAGPQAVSGPLFSDPVLARRRLGQGAFKALVLDSYQRRCAITGHKIAPTLEAAHIRPVSSGGEHRLDNGLLLRSDVHTMFDRGYLTVDSHHRLQVSPRLREEFGNGEEFYQRSREVILLPERLDDRPAREFLEWHGDEVFLAS